MEYQSDLIIIGGGPGGYEVAAEAAREGVKVTLIERADLGGTCLNRGCIPTKCLCASATTLLAIKRASEFGIDVDGWTAYYDRAVDRMHGVVEQLHLGVEGLLKDVNVVRGEARLGAPRIITEDDGSGWGRPSSQSQATVLVGDDVYTAPMVLVATGSKPAILPIPGAELAMTSDDFLRLRELPRRVCIVGGGVIGMEFASIIAAYGSEVTVIEYCPEILPPFDREVAKRLRMTLSRRGVKTIVGAAVTAITKDLGVDWEGGPSSARNVPLVVTYQGKKGEEHVECDAVIMAVGRRPVVPEGCADAGVNLDKRGFIETDELMRTSAPGIYAVGDVNGKCMLAHAATAQARVALGEDVDLEYIPSAVFTTPECAMVGITEEQCRAEEIDYGVGKAMFAGNGKAVSMGEGEGFVKVLYSKATGMMLGCHIIGPHAADLVAEATAHMVAGTNIEEIAYGIVHGHPTLSEALAAACAAAK